MQALSRLSSVTAQIPARNLRAAVLAVDPTARPERMTVAQIARTLGVQGVAAAAGVPANALASRLGPEACAMEDIIRPNPAAGNGREALALAYLPVPSSKGSCGCHGGTMRGLWDEGGELPSDPKPPSVGPDGWPAAVAFRAGNWNFDKCEYTLASGDTLSGVSRTYLLRPDRWLEIWQLQPFRWTYKPDPSSKNPGRPIKEGDVFIMPKEACDRAKEMYAQGKPSAPATGGAPGTIPGQSKDGVHKSAPTTSDDKKKYLMIGGAALAGVVVIGGIAYAIK